MGACACKCSFHLSRRGRVSPWSSAEGKEGLDSEDEFDCRPMEESYEHDGRHCILLSCQSQGIKSVADNHETEKSDAWEHKERENGSLGYEASEGRSFNDVDNPDISYHHCASEDIHNRIIKDKKTSLECISNNTSDRDSILADEENHDEKIANVKHILVRSRNDTCNNLSDKADDWFFQNVTKLRTSKDDHDHYTGKTICEPGFPCYDENQLKPIHAAVLNDGAALEVNNEFDIRDLSVIRSEAKLISGNEDEDNVSEIDCPVSDDKPAFLCEAGIDKYDFPTSDRPCHANTTVPFAHLTVIESDDDDACDSLPVLHDAESCEEMSYDSDAVVSTAIDKIEPGCEIHYNGSVDEHSVDETEFVFNGGDYRNHDDDVASSNENIDGCGGKGEDRTSTSEDKMSENENYGYGKDSHGRDIAQDHPQMVTEPPSKMAENTLISDHENTDISMAQPDVNNGRQTGQLLVLETYQRVVLHIDPELVGYIYERKHFRDQFMSKLEEKDIKFDWKADNDLASILYRGNDEKECLKTVKSFLEMFSKCEIPVKEDIWHVALLHIRNIPPISEEEAPKIEPLETKFILRIISLKSDIDFYSKQLRTKLRNMSKEANFDKEMITKYPKRYIKFLTKINFVENHINSNCKDCRVQFDEENSTVYLNGPKEQLAIAVQEFDEQELATCREHLDLPQNFLEILLTEKGKRAVEEALQKCQSTCLFSVMKSDGHFDELVGEILGNSDKDVEEAIAQISQIAALETIYLEESNVALTATPEWYELCESISAQTEVRINSNNLPDIEVTGLRDDVKFTVQQLQNFLDKNSVRKECYACRSRFIKEFLREFRRHDLQLIEEKLEKYDVKITDSDAGNFSISARGDGLKQARELLAEIADCIVADRLTIKQPGLRKTFERVKGDSIVEKIGKDHKCLIEMKKKFHRTDERTAGSESDIDDDIMELSASTEDPSVLVYERYKISWKIGNIADEQVHALVIPEGECSNAIRKNNPAISEFIKVGAEVGDISVSPGFKLECHHVFHTRCSDWSGGCGEQILRAIVQKSLQKVVEIGGTSIAFPVIGTGNLRFPPNQASAIMIDETLKFCKRNPSTCLRDVRFVAFGQNRRVVSALGEELIKMKQQNEKHSISCSQTRLVRGTRSLYVEIVKGNITSEKTDAIVNMIGSDMNMNNAGELSKAILRAGGTQVQLELEKFQDQKAAPALITTGGNLQARHVIHLIPGVGSFEKNILICLTKCFQLAEEKSLQSVSLPAIGTGRYGLSPKKSARIICLALSNFEKDLFSVKHVRIVIQSHEIYQQFHQEKEVSLTAHLPNPTVYGKKRSQLEIEIVSGDLIDEQTDAIFNIINTDMVMSNAGQVSKAIAKACGPAVESECRALNPQPGGSAVLTKAGNLRARNIIHLIPISSAKQHLQMCLDAGLQLADKTGLHSISLPAIGTGGYGMSDVISANMIFQSLGNFRKTCKHIRKVNIVILQEKMIGAFRQEKAIQETDHEIKLEVWITGNDAESVFKAADTLKKDFSTECLRKEVCDEGVSKLSDDQLRRLLQQARTGEVDISVEAAENRISVCGDQREVTILESEIYKEIVSSKKEEEERQRDENASMVSKTVEWVYELNGEKGVFTSETNYIIEKAHSKDHPSVNISLKGDEFVIDLSKKMGYGQHSKEQITVIRRLKQADEIPLPDCWSLMTTEDVLSVPLDTNSLEYQQVFAEFFLTAENANITRIHRIQNPFRYRSYTLRKQKMEKDNCGANERQLFHGTATDSTAAINLQGFNRSYCGKNGTVYGQGVYFARDASYSLNFTSNEDNEKCMYFARVLVGQFCEGNKEMKAPPPKDPNIPEMLFDSTVNKTVNPEIFVAYSDDQCYPEYLIYLQWNPPTIS